MKDVSNLANETWLGVNFNDRTKSIQFVGISYVRVCLHADAGNCIQLTGSVANLAPLSYESSISSVYFSVPPPDADGDGVLDAADNCPNAANPGQANVVHPLTVIGDACEDPEPDGVMDAVDNCPDAANPLQENNDAAPSFPWIKDGFAPEGTGVSMGGDACDVDDDNDGCIDSKEMGLTATLGGMRDLLAPWDFFDVPQPALLPSSTAGARNKIIALSDVLADLTYVGTSSANPNAANANGAKYGSDLNGNGIADGVEYDRTPSTTPGQPWRSGPPNGTVTLGDVLTVLAQVGTNCD